MAKSKRIIKVIVVLALLAGLAVLFVRSARDSRAQPYTVSKADLARWTLAVEPAAGPRAPVLVLQPLGELAGTLSHQIFQRAMESFSTPIPAAIPLVLRGELGEAFAERATPDALLTIARSAGLDAATPQVRCLGYRRVSGRDGTAQVYFVLFDLPAFARFREQIAALLDDPAARAAYDPGALSPVLLVAAGDSAFTTWLPLRAQPDTDCVAPVIVE